MRSFNEKDIIQEVDEEDKEDEEEKANLAGFLIDKLGLKNDKGQANKIFLSILKKNEDGDEDKLKTIREEDENDINKLKKDIEKVEQDNKKETGENAQDKTEKALLSNIQLLSELNKFKVDKKKDKEEDINMKSYNSYNSNSYNHESVSQSINMNDINYEDE